MFGDIHTGLIGDIFCDKKIPVLLFQNYLYLYPFHKSTYSITFLTDSKGRETIRLEEENGRLYSRRADP